MQCPPKPGPGKKGLYPKGLVDAAFITSNINKDIFRARAIENALQKIVLEADQDLSSFSIVENGKVLLDQIQSNSEVQILQYEIIEESIKNSKYQVTVKALINDETSANPANQICKKVKAESIDFYNRNEWGEQRRTSKES